MFPSQGISIALARQAITVGCNKFATDPTKGPIGRVNGLYPENPVDFLEPITGSPPHPYIDHRMPQDSV